MDGHSLFFKLSNSLFHHSHQSRWHPIKNDDACSLPHKCQEYIMVIPEIVYMFAYTGGVRNKVRTLCLCEKDDPDEGHSKWLHL